MNPQKQIEIWSWFKVIGAIAFLIAWALFYCDHNAAPVEWCAGRVVGKHRSAGVYRPNDGLLTPDRSTYHIDVDVDGHVGSVQVNDFSYNDWPVGTACEVAFRHGRLTDYKFEDIRLTAAGRPY